MAEKLMKEMDCVGLCPHVLLENGEDLSKSVVFLRELWLLEKYHDGFLVYEEIEKVDVVVLHV